MNIKKEVIKELRVVTGAGILECQRALLTTKGDIKKAKSFLESKYGEKANKKTNRTTNEGVIAHYIHTNKKMGAIAVVKCETDFVAQNDIFTTFAKDIAMQVGAMNATNIEELMNQTFVKNTQQTIREYTQQTIAKLGENITIQEFSRFEI